MKCLPIRAEDGWLSDSDIRNPKHKPAPYAEYTGDKNKALWHFDRETDLYQRIVPRAKIYIAAPPNMFPEDLTERLRKAGFATNSPK